MNPIKSKDILLQDINYSAAQISVLSCLVLHGVHIHFEEKYNMTYLKRLFINHLEFGIILLVLSLLFLRFALPTFEGLLANNIEEKLSFDDLFYVKIIEFIS